MDTNTQNPKHKLQLGLTIAVFTLFSISLLMGVYSGITTAQARATYANVANLNQALKYYFNDQGAYPSKEQFDNQRILIPYYLREIPEAVSASGKCQAYKEFQYSQSNPKKYTLQFCLNKGFSGFPAGVHAFTEQGLQ